MKAVITPARFPFSWLTPACVASGVYWQRGLSQMRWELSQEVLTIKSFFFIFLKSE